MKRNSAFLSYLSIFLLSFNLLSCNPVDRRHLSDKIDPTMNMTYDQYLDSLMTKKWQKPNKEIKEQSIIPKTSSMIIAPKIPSIGREKLVTLRVTEDIPIKDVLIELSRSADVGMELDAEIKGGIIMKVKDRPFSEVIERICNLANLRFYNNNGILKIERDVAYLENYSLDFLNISRSNNNTSQISTSLASSSSGSGGSSSGGSSSSSSSGGNLGSTTSLKSSYDSDLWQSVENDLRKIAKVSVIDNSESRTSESFDNKIASLDNNYLSINKQASMISIYAPSKIHKQVNSYLTRVRKSASSQVLIEAKIVEINLNDEYRAGVNWNELNKQFLGGLTGGVRGSFKYNSDIVGDNKLTLGRLKAVDPTTGAMSTTNLQAVIDATQNFGATRTLASPRIHAMNNQQAILSFVENKVYFSIKVDQTAGTTTAGGGTTDPTITLNSTANTIPIGVIVALQPSINLETEEVTMNIRPTITATDPSQDVDDPAIAYALKKAGVTDIPSKVPVVNIKEIDSVLKIKNGQIMVIGGMMEEISTNRDNGVPFLMSTPMFGNLFKAKARTTKIVQTVIFIKATIMHTEDALNSDKEFYNSFARDKETIY